MTIEMRENTDIVLKREVPRVLSEKERFTFKHGSLIRPRLDIEVISQDQIAIIPIVPGSKVGQTQDRDEIILTANEINTSPYTLRLFPLAKISWRSHTNKSNT